jgi:hypothetical protein
MCARALSSAVFKIPPTISGFSPANGPVGTAVTIAGEQFTGTSAAVRFGAALASFTVDSTNQVTATVPAGAPANARIRVTTSGGSVLSADAFQ